MQSSSSSPVRGGEKHLQGRYKEFFRAECHSVVETWYLSKATPQMRTNLKAVVHGIVEFTGVEAAMSKRVMLQSRADPDILGANAIFNANNGPTLISPSMVPNTIQWLSVATVSQRKAFRETIGLIDPPKLFSHMRHMEDMEPERKYWKTSVGTIGPAVREIKEKHLLHNPSEAYTLPSETLRSYPTNTGSTYAWKLPLISTSATTPNGGGATASAAAGPGKKGSSSSASSSTVGGAGATKTSGAEVFKTVTQRAHDATFKGAPWGRFGLEKGINPTQWLSQTKDDFSETFFLMNKNERRFQNYNDNYIGLLSKQYRNGEKVKKAERKLTLTGDDAAEKKVKVAVGSSTTGYLPSSR